MKQKTPDYIRKSQKDWINRKLKEGWKRFSTLQPAEIVEELKMVQKKLYIEYKNKHSNL
jgi:hypothetical protein